MKRRWDGTVSWSLDGLGKVRRPLSSPPIQTCRDGSKPLSDSIYLLAIEGGVKKKNANPAKSAIVNFVSDLAVPVGTAGQRSWQVDLSLFLISIYMKIVIK